MLSEQHAQWLYLASGVATEAASEAAVQSAQAMHNRCRQPRMRRRRAACGRRAHRGGSIAVAGTLRLGRWGRATRFIDPHLALPPLLAFFLGLDLLRTSSYFPSQHTQLACSRVTQPDATQSRCWMMSISTVQQRPVQVPPLHIGGKVVATTSKQFRRNGTIFFNVPRGLYPKQRLLGPLARIWRQTG